MVKWKDGLTGDQAQLQGLGETVARLSNSPNPLSVKHIQAQLIEIEHLQTLVSDLYSKYQASLAEDDKQRDHLREDKLAFVQARIQGTQ